MPLKYLPDPLLCPLQDQIRHLRTLQVFIFISGPLSMRDQIGPGMTSKPDIGMKGCRFL